MITSVGRYVWPYRRTGTQVHVRYEAGNARISALPHRWMVDVRTNAPSRAGATFTGAGRYLDAARYLAAMRREAAYEVDLQRQLNNLPPR